MTRAWSQTRAALLLLAASCAACAPVTLARSAQQVPLAVDGTVVGVDNRSPNEQLSGGLRVTLQPEGRPTILVELAPGWYLDAHGLRFSEHDRLHVEGTPRAGDPVLFATRVSNGDTSLNLRDSAGRPLWRAPEPPQPAK
jgi:hypothetical protein